MSLGFEDFASQLHVGYEFEFAADSSEYCEYSEDEGFSGSASNKGFTRVMNTNGYSIYEPLEYCHNYGDEWVLGTDSSVCDNDDRVGYELTSRKLPFIESSKMEISNVLELTKNYFNPEVNKRCGTHVHLSGFDKLGLCSDDLESLLECYGYWETVFFDFLVPKSRRANRNYYARSLNYSHISCCYSDYSDIVTDKYFKVSARYANSDNGLRLEFRQHSGTLDVNKIWNWTSVLIGFMKWFIENKSSIDVPSNFIDALNRLDIPKDVKEWAIQRAVGFGMSLIDSSDNSELINSVVYASTLVSDIINDTQDTDEAVSA